MAWDRHLPLRMWRVGLGTRRWCSVYGAVVCGTCHPPADAALVVVWEGEA